MMYGVYNLPARFPRRPTTAARRTSHHLECLGRPRCSFFSITLPRQFRDCIVDLGQPLVGGEIADAVLAEPPPRPGPSRKSKDGRSRPGVCRSKSKCCQIYCKSRFSCFTKCIRFELTPICAAGGANLHAAGLMQPNTRPAEAVYFKHTSVGETVMVEDTTYPTYKIETN